MPTIFTKILSGEIPCHKIAETEDYFAFLDIRPLAKGHTLTIPKKEVDYIFNLDAPMLAGLMDFTQKVARAIEKNVQCKRIGVMVIGTEVPHAHIHLIPFTSESQMSMASPRVEMSHEEMAELAARIHHAFAHE